MAFWTPYAQQGQWNSKNAKFILFLTHEPSTCLTYAPAHFNMNSLKPTCAPSALHRVPHPKKGLTTI